MIMTRRSGPWNGRRRPQQQLQQRSRVSWLLGALVVASVVLLWSSSHQRSHNNNNSGNNSGMNHPWWSLTTTMLLMNNNNNDYGLSHSPVRQALLGFSSSYAPHENTNSAAAAVVVGSSIPTSREDEAPTTTANNDKIQSTAANTPRLNQPPHRSSPTTTTANQGPSSSTETKAALIARLYPNEPALPNPTGVADGSTSFAACLLVMDDNHRLVEWLAYHYHVLPLRYLVVAVDPRSQTTPTHIFNRYRQQTSSYTMTIVEWTDADFWKRPRGGGAKDLAPIAEDAASFQQKRDRHRGRQKFFYKQCLIHMKQQNRTWVSLHDSDEYMLYNHKGGGEVDVDNNTSGVQPNQRAAAASSSVLIPSQPPPTTAQGGGMIRYIEQERAAGLAYYQSPCIGIPRLMFGANPKSIDRDRVLAQVPDSVGQPSTSTTDTDHKSPPLAMQMDTLVYRQHARRNDFVKNALGKVIIDVSRVDVVRTPYFMSLHRPIKTICPPPWHKDATAGLRINHYLGSWDSYSFREDARKGGERSLEQWEYKATTTSSASSTGSSTLVDVDDPTTTTHDNPEAEEDEDTESTAAATTASNTDDIIRPWVTGLVTTHGAETALDMLRDVGLPPTYRNANDAEWHLLPEKLTPILAAPLSLSQDTKVIAFEDWVRKKYLKLQPNAVPS